MEKQRDLVDAIEREIVHFDHHVQFDQVASLDGAKQALQEAVVLPLLLPELFTCIREPSRGVLLFGPPGGSI